MHGVSDVHTPPVDRYVALGSSFASGPGIDPLVDVGCGRSARNYAHLVAERLGLDLVDVSSGGATIDDVLTASQALMSGGTVPPQIGAVGPDTDLVTATVGGNDVGYLRTLLTCSYAADPAGAPPEAAAFLGDPWTGPRSTPAWPGCPRSSPRWSAPSASGRRGPGWCWSTT